MAYGFKFSIRKDCLFRRIKISNNKVDACLVDMTRQQGDVSQLKVDSIHVPPVEFDEVIPHEKLYESGGTDLFKIETLEELQAIVNVVLEKNRQGTYDLVGDDAKHVLLMFIIVMLSF